MKIKILIILFLEVSFFCNANLAQSFSLSINIEESNLFLEKLSKNNEYKSGFDIPYFGVYLTLVDKFSKNISLELKPGFFFGGDFFTGFEIGSNLKYSFSNNKYFIFSGINLHFNQGAGHGVMEYLEAKDGQYTYVGIGSGLNLSDYINLSLSYFYPLDKNYGFAFYESKTYQTNLYGIIRLGIQIQLVSF